MNTYRTPGVYFEWQNPPPPVTPARVDIAGFVGIARRGPLFSPVKVESWQQFLAAFGSYTPQGYLAYAVSGFFANGGRACYVVRVANPNFAQCAAVDLMDAGGQTLARLQATSEGTWAHEMTITALAAAQNTFTLILRLPTGEEEIWRNLSLDPSPSFGQPLARINGTPGTQKQDPQPGSNLLRLLTDTTGQCAGFHAGALALGTARQVVRPEGGEDGLYHLHPEHLVQGLQTLEGVPEVAAVAMPDLIPPPYRPPQPWLYQPPDCNKVDTSGDPPPPAEGTPDQPPTFTPFDVEYLTSELIAHCERLKDRVAVVAVPPAEEEPQSAVAWRSRFDSSYAALYTPWIRVQDQSAGASAGELIAVPPVGHIAGVFAQGDARTGPQKPPANTVIEGAQDVTRALTDTLHGYLNDYSINAIRSYTGRGIRIFGARTLSSDPALRFLNVRRLLLMVERSLLEQTHWLVFEPNNPALWRNMDRVVRCFLDGIYEAGMLDGATAADAYQVTCDATSNPPEETERGRMITQITLFPPAPAEFVIVRIGKTESGTEILEG